MSTSLLYRAFGVRGYRYGKTEYEGGRVVFTITQPRKSYRCPVCGSEDVIGKGKIPRGGAWGEPGVRAHFSFRVVFSGLGGKAVRVAHRTARRGERRPSGGPRCRQKKFAFFGKSASQKRVLICYERGGGRRLREARPGSGSGGDGRGEDARTMRDAAQRGRVLRPAFSSVPIWSSPSGAPPPVSASTGQVGPRTGTVDRKLGQDADSRTFP